jgi:hypothetical protein
MNFNADNPDHLLSNSIGLSTKNHIHRPTATLSGLVVDKVAMGQVFLQVLWFAPNNIFLKCSTPILIHLILTLYNQFMVFFNTSLRKDAYCAGIKIFNNLL